jgi:hypothetical protein
MGIIKYAIKRVKLFNNERFNKHIDIIAKNTGKSKFYIKLDWIINLLLYGTSYTDYFRCDFINLKAKEKKTFFTARTFYKFLNKYNDKKESELLSNKIEFDNLFKAYLKREFIDIREVKVKEFEKFIREKNVVFAKKINGFGGHGVEAIKYDEVKDFAKKYDELMQNEQFLIEEKIKQCDELNAINPNSVESFRVVTFVKGDEVYVVGNSLRFNQGSDPVVGSADDMYCILNEDGTINGNVIDDYGNVYLEHPLTKKNLKDIKVPYVKEAFQMCKEAARLVPKVRYIGWDVAITKDGPCLMEGNEYPGYGVIQFYKLNGSRTGHKKVIDDILNS